ncbi:MAG: ATP-binding protein [Zetaproteobacteria bacterium]|nr:ATP-binding protein [Zetaproteobacteria bacterium]
MVTESVEHSCSRGLMCNLLVMACIFIGAQLGYLFASYPGFASPIWPPSGISLAIILLKGRGVLPGIFFGYLSANLTLDHNSIYFLKSWWGSLMISCGGVLQPWLCSLMIQRSATWPQKSFSQSTALQFILIAGPLGSIIGASIGTFALYNYDDLSPQNFPHTWGTWWIGNCIGACLFTPIIYMTFQNFTRGLQYILPSLLTFGLTTSITIFAEIWQNERNRTEYISTLEHTAAEFRQRFEAIEQALISTKSFFQYTKFMDTKGFEEFAQVFLNRVPEIQAFYLLNVDSKSMSDGVPLVTYQKSKQEEELSTAQRKHLYEILGSTTHRLHDSHNPFYSEVITSDKHIYLATAIRYSNHTPRLFLLVKINTQAILETLNHSVPMSDYRYTILEPKSQAMITSAPLHPQDAVHTDTTKIDVGSTLWIFHLEKTSLRKSWMSWVIQMLSLILALTLSFVMINFRDRTEEIRREVRNQTIELITLSEQLKASNEELERFVFTVSHDLKVPLVTMTGFVGMLKNHLEKGELDKVPDSLNRIRSSSAKMSNLISELLNYSRIGRRKKAKKSCDLNKIVAECLTNLQYGIQSKKIEVNIAENLGEICGEYERILQAFSNLIVNAIEHGSSATEPRITIRSSQTQDGDLEVYITDNGEGIDPQHHQIIFELFQSKSESPDSTGVGLAIVDKVMKTHGGKVWVESSPQEGATFVLSFPREIVNARRSLT